jgi:protocatechuate 3,4-dioxygenase beta subunit
VPLLLRVTVVDSATCAPVTAAALDIWHCNAVGEYSGYTAHGVGGARGGTGSGRVNPTDHRTFLRGVQLTDARGTGEFRTVYPGWYQGRAIHIHVKVHIAGEVTRGPRYAGGHVAHTGQLYFPEQTSERVAGLEPYRINTVPRVRNQSDAIFTAGDDSGVLTLTPLPQVPPQSRGGSPLTHGLLGAVVLGVNPLAIPAPVGT